MIRGVPPSVWALRAVVALGPLVALLAAVPQGQVPSLWLVGLVAVGSVGFAFVPEYALGTLVMLVVLLWWARSLGTTVPATAMLAAAALLASHVAAMLLGYGPPTMGVRRDLVLLWALRAAAVWVAAPVIWFVAGVYDGHASPTLFWLAGLATALVGAVVAAVVVPTQNEGS